MDEIKIRAWDKEEKVMVYGLEIPHNSFHFGGMYLSEILNDPNIPVMFYTGLKDENKKEIYKDDIVEELSGQRSVVGYREGAYYFRGGDLGGAMATGHEVEVIGNIWEHPELLK